MYIKSNFIEKSSFEKSFSDRLKDVNFSFFFDYKPSIEELSINEINVYAHEEPNEYFGHHDWIIENSHLFSFILTWSDKVLNNCENSIFFPFGTTWLKSEQYERKYDKIFKVSHLRGNLLKTYGHSLRFEYHSRSKNEVKIPNQSLEVAGIRELIETCAAEKCKLFGNSQFGVIIENTSHRGYFTEKIVEMFLLKTIPVYWGCSNIGDFFNIDGIITFNNVDDAICKLNNLDENYYNSRLNVINENYNLALKYINYEKSVGESITDIFEKNGIL
jgi:hypothetical protein